MGGKWFANIGNRLCKYLSQTKMLDEKISSELLLVLRGCLK